MTWEETHTSNVKPVTWRREIGKISFSHPRPRLMIQIERVLQVSAKDLAVALTWRVTLNPK
jgi:hypothetical protein